MSISGFVTVAMFYDYLVTSIATENYCISTSGIGLLMGVFTETAKSVPFMKLI
ncbi:MAG: hypothetical protein ACT4ON_15865 [Bacteroidota bacterium]